MIIDTILFDWNGTLLDDAELTVDVMNSILREYGKSEVTLSFYREHFDFPVIHYYLALGFSPGAEMAEASRKFVQRYTERMFEPNLFPEVKEVLTVLRERSVKRGIVSAMEHTMLLRHTRFYGLHTLISSIQGVEDTAGSGKTHLAEIVKKRWDICPERTVYVGDTTHDRDFAHTMGCRVILKKNGHNSVGRLTKSGEVVIASLDEILYMFH